MSKSAKKLTVEAAYQRWTSGESFVALKKLVDRPMMDTFTKLAGVGTWKQAIAARKASVKKARVTKAKVA